MLEFQAWTVKARSFNNALVVFNVFFDDMLTRLVFSDLSHFEIKLGCESLVDGVHLFVCDLSVYMIELCKVVTKDYLL